MTTIKIYLIDDQAMIRAAFRALLGAEPEVQVVGDNADAHVAVEEVGRLRPDVILLDISMPGLSGLDAITRLHAVLPKVRIVMLTHHEGQSFVERALCEGAEGYLSKDSDLAELMLAIRAVHRGDPYVSPKVSAGLVSRVRGSGGSPRSQLRSLTPREREVFQLLALGKSNKEIAAGLKMSLGTAKKHRENLQRKLDCHSAAELARLAIREGLMEAG